MSFPARRSSRSDDCIRCVLDSVGCQYWRPGGPKWRSADWPGGWAISPPLGQHLAIIQPIAIESMTTYILCSATIAALFVGAIIGGLVVLATGANDRVSRHREATIGRDAIAAARAADAAIAPQALAAEFSAWWRNQGWTFQPGPQTIQTHVAWAQHILNRGVDNG